jgi:hypothetical protein
MKEIKNHIFTLHTIQIPNHKLELLSTPCIPWGDTVEFTLKESVDLSWSQNPPLPPAAFSPDLPSGGNLPKGDYGPYTVQAVTATVTVTYTRKNGDRGNVIVTIAKGC